MLKAINLDYGSEDSGVCIVCRDGLLGLLAMGNYDRIAVPTQFNGGAYITVSLDALTQILRFDGDDTEYKYTRREMEDWLTTVYVDPYEGF